MDIPIQESKHRSSRKRCDRLIVPIGLGLSRDEFQPLVDDWIVPRLVQTFVEQKANYVISRSSEKKPTHSVSLVPPSRFAKHESDISRFT